MNEKHADLNKAAYVTAALAFGVVVFLIAVLCSCLFGGR